MTYEPKPGDRIRQTIVREGVVRPEGRMAASDDGFRFTMDPDAYSGTVTNELIEPHYPVGSLWMSVTDVLYERTDNTNPWYAMATGVYYPEPYPPRPLTRLYREGEQS